MIELHRVDLGQKLALLDTVADVHVALADIAAGARQNRRFRHRLDAAGQHQLAFRRRLIHQRDIHRRQRHGLLLRLFGERRLAIGLRQISREKSPRQNQRRDDAPDSTALQGKDAITFRDVRRDAAAPACA